MSKYLENQMQIIEEYFPKLNSTFPCYTKGEIPWEKYKNACQTYAGNVDYEDVIGLIDETVWGSGKKGFLFTVDGFYYDRGSELKSYLEGISFNSLPSSYNIAMMNEMLEALYYNEQQGLVEILERSKEIDETCNETMESLEKLTKQVHRNLISMESLEEYMNYVKSMIAKSKVALECSPEVFSEKILNILQTWIASEQTQEYDKKLDLLSTEVSSWTYTEYDDDFNSIEKQYVEWHNVKLEEIAKKTMKQLKVYHSYIIDADDEEELLEDIIKCRKILSEYYMELKNMRKNLKDLKMYLLD